MVGRHLSLAMLKSKKYYDLLFQHALLHLPGFALQNFVKKYFLLLEERTPKTREDHLLNQKD